MPSSSAAVTRAATASRRNARPFVSLRGRSAFARLYREGDRRAVGAVVVLAAPGASGVSQVGFVAGRRVGNAVRRNRAKRRLREAMARIVPAEGTAFVVIAQPGVNDASFPQLVEWLAVACSEPDGSEESDE